VENLYESLNNRQKLRVAQAGEAVSPTCAIGTKPIKIQQLVTAIELLQAELTTEVVWIESRVWNTNASDGLQAHSWLQYERI
jgi:succinyl-CoA synthetase alpha subunit